MGHFTDSKQIKIWLTSQGKDILIPGANQESKVHGANMGPSGSCWPQMGPMLAPWTLLSGKLGPTMSNEYKVNNGNIYTWNQ